MWQYCTSVHTALGQRPLPLNQEKYWYKLQMMIKKQRENRLEIQEVHENFMLKRSILLNFKITVLKFVVIFVLS